jgi:hypothetical protein
MVKIFLGFFTHPNRKNAIFPILSFPTGRTPSKTAIYPWITQGGREMYFHRIGQPEGHSLQLVLPDRKSFFHRATEW